VTADLFVTADRKAPCPCGLPATYAACCGRFHRGPTTAPTAGLLMRSRYSAFVVGDVEYLLATWHPATRPEELTLDPGLRWTGLEIVSATGGGPDDKRGTVSFVAHYQHQDQPDGTAGEHRENSSFRRQEGRWVYVGEVVS
jgi:SEC-C motif-containing protein